MKRIFTFILFVTCISALCPEVLGQNPDQVYGPAYPPPIGTYQSGANNGDPGRVGGKSLYTSQVSMAGNTTTYWGLEYLNSQLQLMVSLDGGDYSEPGEVLSYDPVNSNLPGGIVRWIGTTFINNAFGGQQQVFTRATMTATRLDNSVIPLVDPTSLGLSDQIGGLIQINGVADFVVANFLIEASFTQDSGYQPYLDLYDAYPTPPGLPPGQGGNAYSSFTKGFYWVNTPPRLDINIPLPVTEGSSAVLNTTNLDAQDMEDLPSNPQGIVFSFETAGATPASHGTLQLNGVPLGLSDHFTQKDLQDGTLVYVNDGSESATDEFQFSFVDSNGKQGIDAGHSVYSFHIEVSPVNDPPITRDTSYQTSLTAALNASLLASDPDNTSLTYIILTTPTKGNIVLNNASTGAFTYTPTLGSFGTDSFTYTANDGTVNGDTSTINILLLDTPPHVLGDTLLTHENKDITKTFRAFDAESEPITITIVSPPSKGTLVNLSGLSYTYHPAAGKFGKDYFTFTATDNQSNTSTLAKVSIDILPTLDRGDLLLADGNMIRLVDPATLQDTILVSLPNPYRAQNLMAQTGTSIYGLDPEHGILKINRNTLAFTVLTPVTGFSSNPGLIGIAMNPAGNLLVTDGTSNVFKIDTLTGAKSVLFTGGNLTVATSMAYLANGDLIVSDAGAFAGGTSRMIRITAAGVQTVVSSGGNLAVPIDFSLIDQNTAVVANAGSLAGGSDNILRIDLATGTQSILSSGGSIGFPSGMTFDDVTGKLYTLNQGSKLLLDINTASGAQTIISGNDGPLNGPFGLQVILAPAAAAPLVKPYATIPADQAIVVATTVSVTATAVTGATSYTIEINTSPAFDGTGFIKTGGKMQSFAGLVYGTKYYTRVKTNLSPNYGSVTSFSLATVDKFTYVASPMNASTGANISLNVTSTAITGATTYTIEINPDQGFGVSTAQVKTGAKTQAFSGLAFDTRYYTRVKTNLSPTWGPTKYFNTGTAVSLCYVTSPGNNATKVSYQPTIKVNDIHASSYLVEIATDNLFTTGVITGTSSTINVPLSGLSYKTKYYAHVASDLGAGFGPVRSFTTESPVDVSYLSSPANNATNVSYSVNLVANVVPGATQYTIEANTDSGFTPETAIVKSGPSRTIGFSLAQDTKYYVRVTTDLNEGLWGMTIRSFTTGDALSLSYITSPKNNGTGVPTTVNVTSNIVPGATTYTIQLDLTPAFGSPLSKSGTRTQKFTGLNPSTTYYARVSTNLTPGVFGATSSFTTANPLAREGDADWVGELGDSTVAFSGMKLNVFPNPFKEHFTLLVESDNQEEAQILLFDMSGKVVREAKGRTNQFLEINGDEFVPGVYILKAQIGRELRVAKVAKY